MESVKEQIGTKLPDEVWGQVASLVPKPISAGIWVGVFNLTLTQIKSQIKSEIHDTT